MSRFDGSDDATRQAVKPAGGKPGQKIGRFEVAQVLGEGAFGRVYLAFDPQLGRQVAIKVPKAEALTREFRERFLREARANATVHHRNVCPVHDVGTEGELPYIVMHYVVGTTLASLLDRTGAPLPPRHALAIARKLALGTAAAHEKGVVHRDLKPANVLYETATREVLITDFGLGLRSDDPRLTTDGAVCGTPAYMSPEQARGRQNEIGPLADVYSLGVILYRMLTGKVPFTGSVLEVLMQHSEAQPRPPSAVYPGLDPRLDAICLKAMAKKPADRYPSAKAFADALTDYLRADGRSESDAELPFATLVAEETAVSAPGAAPAPRRAPAATATWSQAPGAPARRRKGPLVLALLFVVLLAGAGAAWAFRAEIEGVLNPKREVAGTPAPTPPPEPEPVPIAPMPHLPGAAKKPDPKVEPKAKAPEKPDPKKLFGRWERIFKKVKGGEPEVWDFTGDWKIHKTGAVGSPSTHAFMVEDDKITVDAVRAKDGTTRVTYTIHKLTDDDMELEPPLGKVLFVFRKLPAPKEVMRRSHIGPDALLTVVEQSLKADLWADAHGAARGYADLAEKLGKAPAPRGDPRSWEALTKRHAENAQALLKATEAKSAATARDALTTVRASCVNCHKFHK